MDRKPSPVRFPLHSDVSLLAQRRRELLCETHQKAPQARRVPLPPGTQRCHPPLPRRHQCKPKALYLDQAPQQNHRGRQARAPNVRFDPLAGFRTVSALKPRSLVRLPLAGYVPAMSNPYGITLDREWAEWAAKIGVSPTIAAALLLISRSRPLPEIVVRLTPGELEQVVGVIGRWPECFPPGTLAALKSV